MQTQNKHTFNKGDISAAFSQFSPKIAFFPLPLQKVKCSTVQLYKTYFENLLCPDATKRISRECLYFYEVSACAKKNHETTHFIVNVLKKSCCENFSP